MLEEKMRRSVSILVLSLILAAGFGLSACSRSDSVEAAREPDAVDRSNNLTAEDKEFIEYAAEMHAGEIKLAQLAQQKSLNDDVKDYADAVIASHTDALKKLSDRTGQSRWVENKTISLDTKRHADYLLPLTGDQFDQEFIAVMIADHKDAASTFKAPYVEVQNKELKSYLNDTVPALEVNLNAAQKLKK
jgi:putative membrane protein